MTTAGQEAQVTAGIYCRISLAAIGDTVKVDDQERICRDLAAQLGWKVVEGCGHPHHDGVYTDNNRSAWQKNRNRPAWNQMLKDVQDGKINAIVVYHGDRLVRRPEDLADLMKLADSKGVRLASPTGTHNLDKDRLELWIRAAFAEEESQRTSERRKTQYERWRREGRVRPGGRGGRAFGFETDGVTHRAPSWCELATRREVSEADAIRDMAARILAGEDTGSVCRGVTADGWRTPAGNKFTHGTLRKMLMRPRYAGLMPDGENQAAWEPVLDRRDWERVCEVLEGKAASFSYATNARHWLLSGIAVCGAPFGDGQCGAPMQIRPSKGRGRQEYTNGYGCSRAECRKAYRSAPHLDAYVGAQVVTYLGSPLNPQAQVPASPVDAREWEALATERAATEAQVKDYRTSAGRVSLLMARLDSIDERMEQLRERETSSTRTRLIERYRGITREQWEDELTLDVRRSLVAACFTVTVLPASGRGPGFRPQDVRVEPAG